MKRLKNLLMIALLVAMSMLLAGALKPGTPVANFSLPDPSGKIHQLDDYKGSKAIAIVYVSTKCPVSNAYNERMARLHAAYADKGVVFLGINANKRESLTEIASHAEKNGLNFTILKDEGNKVADIFGATVTPEVYLLDGNLTLQYHGHIDDSQRPGQIKRNSLQVAIDEMLAGQALSVSETKAFGCSIKRVR